MLGLGGGGDPMTLAIGGGSGSPGNDNGSRVAHVGGKVGGEVGGGEDVGGEGVDIADGGVCATPPDAVTNAASVSTIRMFAVSRCASFRRRPVRAG
jgi:hypothetical protein